jgi:hypothetical protein
VKLAEPFDSLVTTKSSYRPGGTSVSTRTRTLTNAVEPIPARLMTISLRLLSALVSRNSSLFT